jgi:hypothetical protein
MGDDKMPIAGKLGNSQATSETDDRVDPRIAQVMFLAGDLALVVCLETTRSIHRFAKSVPMDSSSLNPITPSLTSQNEAVNAKGSDILGNKRVKIRKPNGTAG